MASTELFDILLQFQQSVTQDLQHRLLNASPLTNLWVKSPFSRRIEQPVPPLEVKACWNKPDVTFNNNGVELATELNGGARQVLTERILTLDGTVSAKQSVTFAVDTSQRPYACVTTPNPLQISTRQLKVSYEGSHWPPFLAKLNPVKEATVLRPVLASELFEPLARLPLTYMPHSLPIAPPAAKGKSVKIESAPIKHLKPRVLNAPASVVLGLMLDKTRTIPSTFTSLLPQKTSYNAAIGVSTQGFNTLLTHLCHQGEAQGQAQHSQLGQVHWCWETLTVTLLQQVVHLSGILVHQGIKMPIEADVRCQLATTGCVQCSLLSSNVTAMVSETLLTSWTELLKTLFRSRAANKEDQDPLNSEKLFQCFDLPGTEHTVETIAQELLIIDDQLIIYYIIPKSLKELQVELPPPKPTVTIIQSYVPTQSAEGAPITIELEAKITKDSTPPYDYAWTTDLSQNPTAQFGPKLTVHSIPSALVTGTGPQILTTAHLKVIDMFGQVVETQAPAKYLPYSQLKQKQNKSKSGRGMSSIGAVLVVIVVILGLYAAAHSGGVSPSSTLEGSMDTAPSSIIDLSTEGTLDWIHWGYVESDNASSAEFIGNPINIDCQTNNHCANRKKNANAQISDFTTFGSFDASKLPYRLYARDVLTRFAWNDGSPIFSATNARTTDYMAGSGNGFKIQVPADQTTHTLRVYLALWQAKLKFTASLSDGSAPDYVDTSVQPRAYYTDIYSVTYRASSPNQILTITLTILSDYGGANISLIAATLQ